MSAKRKEHIVQVLSKQGPLTIRSIRALVSGTPAEIQKSLEELRKNGVVVCHHAAGMVGTWRLVVDE